MVRHLWNLIGVVAKISPSMRNKAVIEFIHGEDQGKAILWSDRLMVKGHTLLTGEEIEKYLEVGNRVKFSCHNYDNPDIDGCTWFVTTAFSLDDVNEEMKDLGIHCLAMTTGVVNQTGVICHVTKRQAVISFTGNDEKVLLLGSKCYVYGKRLNAKSSLVQLLEMEEEIKFDAIPFEEECNNRCNWLATVAWKGSKPEMPYDVSPPYLPSSSDIDEYKSALNNPHAKFYFGHGKIISILSDEYGICLSPVKENNWQTVLFHRSNAYLFGSNLNSVDLHQVFQQGDRVRFLAVPTSAGAKTQWLARQLFVDTTHCLSDVFMN